MEISVEFTSGYALIYSPYNKKFVELLKERVGGARWMSDDKYWCIPESAIDTAREIMRSVYGECDIPDGGKKLTLRVHTQKSLVGFKTSVNLFAKTIAHAYNYEKVAPVEEGVTYLEKSPKSGGTKKQWMSIVPADSLIVLSDVPEVLYNKYLADKEAGELEEKYQDIEVEVVDTGVDVDALKAEREKLLARIAEIDTLLAATA